MLAALLLLPTGSSWAQTSQEPTTIRLATAPDDSVTPALYAQRAGLFRAAGIVVDVQRVTSGGAAVTAVVAGAADVAQADLLPLITAHSRGVPLVLIAPSGIYSASNPTSGIIVLKGSPIRSARDLSGKTVSAPGLAGLSWLGANVWLDKNGGDSKAVRFLEVPNPVVGPALEAGRIDVGTVANPSFGEDVATGKYRVIGDYVGAIGARLLQTGYFATASYATKNREAVVRFVRVLRQASEYTNRHRDETVDLLASFSGLDLAAIQHMNRVVAGTTLDAGEIQPLIDAASKYKLIQKPFPAQDLIGP